jgi:hypothetical protein
MKLILGFFQASVGKVPHSQASIRFSHLVRLSSKTAVEQRNDFIKDRHSALRESFQFVIEVE